MDPREANKALIAILAALIVLLLLSANIQLWRLWSQDDAKGDAVATAPSALPPPVSGTSNEILSKRLRQFSNGLADPFSGLSAQLADLQGLGGAQRDVAAQIKELGDSIRLFGGVRREIGRMTDNLGKMIANTSGLATMGRDMRATRMSMSGMVRVMKRVEGGIAATSTASQEASAGILAMRDATLATADSFAATAANGRELTAFFMALNERMSSLVEIFCVTFNSTIPACATAETGGTTVITPERSEIEPDRSTSEKPAGGEAPPPGLSPGLQLEPSDPE